MATSRPPAVSVSLSVRLGMGLPRNRTTRAESGTRDPGSKSAKSKGRARVRRRLTAPHIRLGLQFLSPLRWTHRSPETFLLALAASGFWARGLRNPDPGSRIPNPGFGSPPTLDVYPGPLTVLATARRPSLSPPLPAFSWAFPQFRGGHALAVEGIAWAQAPVAGGDTSPGLLAFARSRRRAPEPRSQTLAPDGSPTARPASSGRPCGASKPPPDNSTPAHRRRRRYS